MIPNFKSLMSVAVAAGLLVSLLTIVPALPQTAAVPKTSPTQTSQSAQVEKFTISGNLAQASWFIENEDGTFTDVFISLVDAATKPEDLFPTSFLDVAIFQYELVEQCFTNPDGSESCFIDFVPIMDFFGSAEIQGSQFSIAKNLRSASADSIEVSGFDFVSGEEKTISVSANWLTDGSLIKIKRIISDSDGEFKFSFKAMGTGRDGTATAQITGDINLNTEDGTSDSEASVLRIREGQMLKIVKGQ